jgi:GNAT superfamily N-acetyltransferase
MEGPRPPSGHEWSHLLSFLTENLRKGEAWSISDEYPTALTPSNLHNVRIMTENEQIVSHAVFKPLIIKTPHIILKIGAIGSVVTDERYRHQGLSREILKACLNLAQDQHCDFAILWTQLFDFYRKLGFELAGNEMNYIFEHEFKPLAEGLRFSADPKVAPESLYRLYGQHTINTVRTLEEFKKYLKIPKTQIYTAWDSGGQLAAYAIEGKGADLTDYIHEWGGGVKPFMSLLSWIRKTKGRPFTLIAPRHSQNLLNEIKKVAPIEHQGYLGMLKVIDFDQLSAKVKKTYRNEGIVDIVLERQGPYVLFGCGTDLITLERESDLTQILLGPMTPESLPHLKPLTVQKLSKILPLPLWLWGWDSI